jgi:hypothetical protein
MMTWTGIEFAPLLPWPLIAALAGAALLFSILGAVARARGWSWRFLAAAILTLALLNPALVEEQREPLKDIGIVVLDESPSQQIGDRLATQEKAFKAIMAQADAFKDTLDLRVLRVRHDGVSDAEDGTAVFAELANVMRDIPNRRFAGAIFLTDGQIHDTPKQAKSLSGPIHTLLTGRANEYDRRLIIKKAPNFGIVGKPLEMTLFIEDTRKSGGETRLTVRRDGGAPRVLIAPVGVEFSAPFTLEHAGPTVLELNVEGAPAELSTRNNSAIVSVNGVRDRLRVLLVSGEPHTGERTWRNLLKADPSVDLVHFTILRPPEKQDGTPINELSLISFPTRELFEVRIGDFDLVIFDRYRRRGVLPPSYLRNIADYVRDGGALLEAVGPAFAGPLSIYRSPLGKALPGEPTGEILTRPFRPLVTAVGQRHPVTAGLSNQKSASTGDGDAPTWGKWFRQIDVEATRGRTVMTGSRGRPLLILDRYGKGRVAQLNSDHIWLWARGYDGGGPQAELLRRLAHWLMQEPALEENDLRAKVRGDTLEITRRNIDGNNKSVQLRGPDGVTRELALTRIRDGEWGVKVPVSDAGLYEVTDGERNVVAASGSLNALEFSDIRATEQRMKPVSSATDGGLFWLASSASDLQTPKLRRTHKGRPAHGRNWVGMVANGDYIVTGVDRISVLPTVLVLVLALGAIALAWRREAE